MGGKDLHRIYPVYRACVDYTKKEELPFTFKQDSTKWRTALQFFNTYDKSNNLFMTCEHPPFAKDWDDVPTIFEPDILILKNNKPLGVIEYEEETGKRKSGAHYADKGHGHEGDPDNKKDSRRNEYYDRAGLKVFRLWDSVYKKEDWKAKLHKFLIECNEEETKKR